MIIRVLRNFKFADTNAALIEHMDDLLQHDKRKRSLLVAILGLRLVRLLPRSMFRLHDRPYRRYVPYLVPGRGSFVVWDLGCVVAGV